MFKFWLGRLFVGTESSNHLEQNFKNVSCMFRACISSKIDHTLLLLNQMHCFSEYGFSRKAFSPFTLFLSIDSRLLSSF